MKWPSEDEEVRMNNIVLNGNTGEHYEHIAQRRLDKVREKQLLRHPSCLDPDHPGCERCEEPSND